MVEEHGAKSKVNGERYPDKVNLNSDDDKRKESVQPDGQDNSVSSEAVLQNKVGELEGQIATLKEAVIRKLAETENLRKRLEKEKLDAIKYANSKFAKDLLGVIDNFERVMQHIEILGNKVKVDEALRPIAEGIELCGKELLSIFRKHGIDQVSVSEGIRFDPNYHQAVCEVESDRHSPGTVVSVMQPGYTYNDRLLRPAMVGVAKKAHGENQSGTNK